jgi:hypothetical protein
LLKSNRTAFTDGLGQLRSLAWRERMYWLCRALFPTEDYMRYEMQDEEASLLKLYATRIFRKIVPRKSDDGR